MALWQFSSHAVSSQQLTFPNTPQLRSFDFRRTCNPMTYSPGIYTYLFSIGLLISSFLLSCFPSLSPFPLTFFFCCIFCESFSGLPSKLLSFSSLLSYFFITSRASFWNFQRFFSWNSVPVSWLQLFFLFESMEINCFSPCIVSLLLDCIELHLFWFLYFVL